MIEKQETDFSHQTIRLARAPAMLLEVFLDRQMCEAADITLAIKAEKIMTGIKNYVDVDIYWLGLVILRILTYSSN
jgi:hypothetical protein